jgi:hypothetical protein
MTRIDRYKHNRNVAEQSATLTVGSIVRITSEHNFYNGRLAVIIGHVQFAMSELDCYWVRITDTQVTCLERANELRLIDRQHSN